MEIYRLSYSKCLCLAVLTNLQKINSLPVEVQSVSLNNTFDTTIPIQKINGHSGIYSLQSDSFSSELSS
jgi:hypothetical protein